jgi:hydroxypyruvate isomerase
MTEFAANLSMLFTERPFLDRLDAAADAGFSAVEFWWPNQALSQGVTPDEIVARVRELNLEVVLLNFDAGDLSGPDRGLAGDPDRAWLFRQNVPVAIDLARRIGCRKLNALAGNVVSGHDRAEQQALAAESVKFAADSAAREGISVMLEPLNPTDFPDYLLPNVETVLSLIERVGRPNVRVQFDTYHIARAGDDVLAAVRRCADLIGHVQFADCPGRHEPGTGELPFATILADLQKAGYSGPVGLEFTPLVPGAPDFSFVRTLGG